MNWTYSVTTLVLAFVLLEQRTEGCLAFQTISSGLQIKMRIICRVHSQTAEFLNVCWFNSTLFFFSLCFDFGSKLAPVKWTVSNWIKHRPNYNHVNTLVQWNWPEPIAIPLLEVWCNLSFCLRKQHVRLLTAAPCRTQCILITKMVALASSPPTHIVKENAFMESHFQKKRKMRPNKRYFLYYCLWPCALYT